MTLQGILLVALGGAVGCVARYGVGILLDPKHLPQAIPYATLLVNILGSLVLGYVLAQIAAHPDPQHETTRLLVGVGFCGGFTTMSTFAVETMLRAESGALGLAIANVALQLTGCLGAAALGIWLARR